MSTSQRRAETSFRAFRSLVLTVGLLAGVAGSASAASTVCTPAPGYTPPPQCACTGEIDFCTPNPADGLPWYDNKNTIPGAAYTGQTTGCFTDVDHSGWRPPGVATITWRPPQITLYQGMAWVDTSQSPPFTLHAGTNPWGDSLYKPQQCGLNFYGNSELTSNNHAEMWATIVQPPGFAPLMQSGWDLKATMWYDNVTRAPNPRGSGGWNNNKGVGIITNYNPANRTGLFLALFDAGNTEFLCLEQFDLSPQPPNNMNNPTVIFCKSLAVGSILSTGDGGSATQSYPYVVSLRVSTPVDASYPSGYALNAVASVYPATVNIGGHTCPDDYLVGSQQCMVYHGGLPSGILGVGAVGIATLAPTSGSGVVDTYISKITVTPGSLGD